MSIVQSLLYLLGRRNVQGRYVYRNVVCDANLAIENGGRDVGDCRKGEIV
jgi:hypothetical protein